ncbi:WXG100 family type VII secretion target [Actinomycetospora flava]|uniref:WXG100 family type VII secretion target n=1 Tax=Actinomycetospora flava TaxID=3129232 RepID=A0ABU8M808_9PSEU
MPVPGVPWGGRDTSVLSHELIHRWIHDGADPAALDSARLRHAARGEELRAAAQRLERAHGQLGASWRGRDAEAAASHVRTLVARMSRLGDAVTGQAGSLQGVRDALARVQSLVAPPRAPALPVLGTSPATPGLAGALAAGGPADGFGTFQAAQAEERAAQGAYRAYLEQTGLAARGAPSAVDGLAGRSALGAAPEAGGTARGATAGPGGVPGGGGPGGAPAGRGGVLARAAAPAAASPGAPGAGGGPPGRAPGGVPEAARPGTVGRFVSRLLGGPGGAGGPGGPASGGAPGAGAPGRPAPRAGPGAVGPGGPVVPGGRGTAGPGTPGGRATAGPAGTAPRSPAHPVAPTAADRLAGGGPGAAGRGATPERRREEREPPDRGAAAEAGAEEPWRGSDGPGSTPGPTGPSLAGPSVGVGGHDVPGVPGGTAPPPTHAGTAGTAGAGSPDVPMIPPTAGAAASSPLETSGGVRHPEYLVDADPWRDPADDPDERRLVTPPVIGEQDGR